jgi:hypothetical protein
VLNDGHGCDGLCACISLARSHHVPYRSMSSCAASYCICSPRVSFVSVTSASLLTADAPPYPHRVSQHLGTVPSQIEPETSAQESDPLWLGISLRCRWLFR